MPTLSALSHALAEARTSGRPELLGPALIAWAEAAPIFRYRSPPVEEALIEASRLLPALGQPQPLLEGRCLLRLGEVKMQQGLLDQAAQLVDLAEPRLRQGGGDEPALRAACLRTRILRRRGDEAATQADRLLAELSAVALVLKQRRAPSATSIALTLAVADAEVERLDDGGIDTLRGLLNLLDRHQVEAPDARFAAHQGIALLCETSGRLDVAIIHLRAAVALVKPFGAPLDLIECRLALGTALSAARQHAEARRVLQLVIDDARALDGAVVGAGRAGRGARRGRRRDPERGGLREAGQPARLRPRRHAGGARARRQRAAGAGHRAPHVRRRGAAAHRRRAGGAAAAAAA
jgi:ATP/maltotriose-dependent transcriptional regulator MalT